MNIGWSKLVIKVYFQIKIKMSADVVIFYTEGFCNFIKSLTGN
jgi:hypothetical protein